MAGALARPAGCTLSRQRILPGFGGPAAVAENGRPRAPARFRPSDPPPPALPFPATPPATVGELVAAYLGAHGGTWSETSARVYATQARYLLRAIGTVPVGEATGRLGRDLLRRDRDRASLCGQALELLRRAGAWHGVEVLVGLPRYRACKREETLTERERHRLDRALAELADDASWRTPLDAARFVLATGLSQGDVRGLRWADVDLRAGSVRLPPRKRSGWRVVPIGRTAQGILLARPRAGEWCFPGRTDAAPVGATSLCVALDAGCARARVRRVSPHVLRHSTATTLAERGATVAEIAALLGQSSTTSALRYIHARESRTRALAETLATKGPEHDAKSSGSSARKGPRSVGRARARGLRNRARGGRAG